VKLVLEEPGTDDARDLFVNATSVQSSRLLVPETHAALVRAKRGRRLGPAGEKRTLDLLRQLLAEVDPLELDEGIADRAGEMARALGLRGSDAVHLASYERAEIASSVLVVPDGDLAHAALSLGHAVAVPGA
jgi:predicted nucleic acid-binding protein